MPFSSHSNLVFCKMSPPLPLTHTVSLITLIKFWNSTLDCSLEWLPSLLIWLECYTRSLPLFGSPLKPTSDPTHLKIASSCGCPLKLPTICQAMSSRNMDGYLLQSIQVLTPCAQLSASLCGCHSYFSQALTILDRWSFSVDILHQAVSFEGSLY